MRQMLKLNSSYTPRQVGDSETFDSGVPNLCGAEANASWDAQFAAMETGEGYRSLQLAIAE